MALVPVGTPRDTFIVLDGILHTICQGDPRKCDGSAWDTTSHAYFDGEGVQLTDDFCAAVSVELPAKINCCSCNVVCALVPEEFPAVNNTPVFAVEYANDGTPIPALAVAGDVKVGYVAEKAACSVSHWDNVSPVPPAGMKYIYILTVGLS